MRTQTREYLEKFLKEHEGIKTILDIGSYEAGGGTIRDLVAGYDYLGIDMRKGEGVDRVINGHDLKDHFEEGSFDLVLCFDTFEHDDAWWITLENMKWVVKRGGWIMIGAPSRYCPEHDHPHDYWRFMPQAANVWFDGLKNVEVVVDKGSNTDMEDEIYGWGQKV